MMPPPTTMPASPPAARHLRWQLLWHRALQRLGWPGLVGVLLFVFALMVGALAWQAKRNLTMLEQASRVSLDARVSSSPQASASGAATEASLAQAAPLPARSDIHALIGQIQRSASQQQLVWLAADYRYKAATAESLARLEVHGSLRGPYKPLRLWLAQLKEDVPSLLLQEANINRPNADVAEVDAKLVLVFALADAAPLGSSVSLGFSGTAPTPHAQQSSGATR